MDFLDLKTKCENVANEILEDLTDEDIELAENYKTKKGLDAWDKWKIKHHEAISNCIFSPRENRTRKLTWKNPKLRLICLYAAFETCRDGSHLWDYLWKCFVKMPQGDKFLASLSGTIQMHFLAGIRFLTKKPPRQ